MSRLHIINRTLAFTLSMASACVCVSGAQAREPHDEIVRRDIALIQSQLHQIGSILDRLEQRQRTQIDEETPLFLDIRRIRSDIATVRKGLDDYLSPAVMPPRRLLPIEDDLIDDALVGQYTRKAP